VSEFGKFEISLDSKQKQIKPYCNNFETECFEDMASEEQGEYK